MKSVLRLYEKKIFSNGCVLEMRLWEITKNNRYPEGIKYNLIFICSSGNRKVLMDNHSPKGHHYHLDYDQFEYLYQGIPQLLEDFKFLVKKHTGVNL